MDRPSIAQLYRQQFWIIAVAGLVFFTNLGAAELFDEDEPKNAVCGREMYLRGDWIVPTFNDELRTDKPILIYWIMLCSYTVFGVSEFAARFGSAVLAVGTVLMTYHLGRMLFSRQVGFLAAIILCSCLMFSAVGRAVTPDSTLIFCTTAAFTAYVWSVTTRFGGRFGEPEYLSFRRRDWHEYAPQSMVAALPMYLAMGAAVLAKGPIGVLLPCAIIGLNLLIRQQLDLSISQQDITGDPTSEPTQVSIWKSRLWRILQTFHPARIGAGTLAMWVPGGAIVVALIALPWYVAVGQATDGAWLAGFLGDHNVGRFLDAKENHSGPIFYYVPVLLMGSFPWSIFLPLTIWQISKAIRTQQPASPSLIFLACWAGFWILFFSNASTKLPNYILPAYPALALLLAWFLDDWQRATSPALMSAMRWSCRGMTAVGGLGMIAVPIVTTLLLPDEHWLIVVGLIPLAGGLFALRALHQADRAQVVRVMATSAVALAVLIVGIAPAHISEHQDGPSLGSLARQLATDQVPELATFEYFAPTLVFYAQTPVDRLKQASEVQKFFQNNPEGLVITRDDRLEVLREFLPSDVQVLVQQRRFLRRHSLILLGRTSPHVAAHLPTSTLIH